MKTLIGWNTLDEKHSGVRSTGGTPVYIPLTVSRRRKLDECRRIDAAVTREFQLNAHRQVIAGTIVCTLVMVIVFVVFG